MSPKKIVLTGGPGTGKTSIIQELQKLGFPVVPEAFKILYMQALARNSADTFFNDQLRLRYELLQKQRELESEMNHHSLVFLDRCAYDIIFFGEWYKIPMPDDLYSQVMQIAYDQVFLIDPLPDKFYQKNKFRFEVAVDARKMHEFFKKKYQKIGVPVIEVPFDTIQKRAEFILKWCYR